MTDTSPRIGFIGAGRVGTALALALVAAGHNVIAISSRSLGSAQTLASRLPGSKAYESAQDIVDAADLVLLTTPDDAIRSTAESLRWREGVAVVHTSGSASRELLESAAEQGAKTGSLHPLLPFADPDVAVANLPGTVFAVEAEGALKQHLLALVAGLGGRPIELSSEDKALYHASCAYAASYIVTMLKLATDIWRSFGWQRADALSALLPALRGTVSNLESLGVAGSLTGPIARGDTGTVERNLAAIDAKAPEQAVLYRALALQAIPVGIEKGGLSQEAASELRRLLVREPILSAREKQK
jgi:predicted short-subunit dehydrogenase-like oxidoreductase (DUF2520 family)